MGPVSFCSDFIGKKILWTAVNKDGKNVWSFAFKNKKASGYSPEAFYFIANFKITYCILLKLHLISEPI